VLAFAAGFSERWAQDTLTGGLSGRGRGGADAAAAATTPAKDPGTARGRSAEAERDTPE